MTALTDYLASLPGMISVQPVEITIKGVTYDAARYTQECSTAIGSRSYRAGERTYKREMIFAIGELPKHYQRRAKAAYTMAGEPCEWYIASHWQGGVNENHPFGNHFLVAPWSIPGSTIDQYERKPYDRVRLDIAYKGN